MTTCCRCDGNEPPSNSTATPPARADATPNGKWLTVSAFCLEWVEHLPGTSCPLRVIFILDGTMRTIDCRAKHLVSFRAFRATVADRLGVWIPASEYAGRSKAANWERDVKGAFEKGAKL
jgi:hypothetical protein